MWARGLRLSAVDALSQGPETLLILGTPIHNVSSEEVLGWIVDRVRSQKPGYIVTSNLDFILKSWLDPEFHRIHVDSNLVIPDGMPMVWISRLFGPPLKERVPGSDLVPRLAEVARDHGFSLYSIGAAPGVAQRAMDLLQQRFPGLRIAGCDSPPIARLLQMDHEQVLGRIRETRPDIVFVAFGAPKQEKWIRMHLDEWNVPVALGVGGSLDFIAGVQRRAPAWIQRGGLEWFWRLAGQPRRLLRRYTANAAFLITMLIRVFLVRLSPAGRVRPDARLRGVSALPRGFSFVELRPLRQARDSVDWLVAAERRVTGGCLVIDLFPFLWLNSLELGALLRLANRCQTAGARLVLSGASLRVKRLLRLFRLDRFMEIPDSAEDLERALKGSLGASDRKFSTYDRAARTLEVELPKEFVGAAVGGAQAEIACHLSRDPVDEIILSGEKVTDLDISGARFIQKICGKKGISGFPGRVKTRFSRRALEAMRKEGFDPPLA